MLMRTLPDSFAPPVRQGSLLGDQRMRFMRLTHPAFRRLAHGVLEANDVTEAPHGVLGRIKRLLIGEPSPALGLNTNN